MSFKPKTLVTALLVVGVVGALVYRQSSTELFKGQIMDTPGETVATTEETAEENTAQIQPDLTGEISFVAPKNEESDMEVEVTIKNIGEGEIPSDTPYNYSIFLNGVEVFSNTDSFTTVAPGDSFNFTYPIPKAIYNYPNSGTLSLKLDTTNEVAESNEGNNEVKVEYSY